MYQEIDKKLSHFTNEKIPDKGTLGRKLSCQKNIQLQSVHGH